MSFSVLNDIIFTYDRNRIAAGIIVPCCEPGRYVGALVDAAWLSGGPVRVGEWQTGTSLGVFSIPIWVMGVNTRPSGVL